MLTALMEEPLMPFMTQLEIGHNEEKSLHSGDMWVVQPLSRRKGEESTAISREQEDSMGEMEMHERLMSFVWVVQSTELTNSS